MAPRAAVLGAGSWGTVFARVLCDAGTDVVLWGRRRELVESINIRRENPDYLRGVALPEGLRATDKAEEALDGAEFVVLAVPSQSLRANLERWRELIPAGAVLVSLMKGVEDGTGKRMSEVIMEVTGVSAGRVAVLTGPNLAREIAARQPTAAVVACSDEHNARRLQDACMPRYFRPYTISDVVGCELGGAVKNVIALAVGMALGLGMGDNVRATLMTRGLAETARLGVALGADEHTFAGLAGMGDLVATCSSPQSRNRSFGENLGRGMSLAQATAAARQTCEGVKSAGAVLSLARKHSAEMPITEVVAAVLRGELAPAEAGALLMSRSPKPERYGM